MKKIKYILFALILTTGATSCSLDVTNYDSVESDNAFSTLKDVRNGMNGAYYDLGSYRFLGNYATAFGDFLAGISAGSASSGHFYAISNFTFADTESEIEDIWNYGFKVVNATTRTIVGGKKVLDGGNLSDDEKKELNSYLGQCYALKALANYYLVNLFALPYSDANKSGLGLPLVKDEPIEAFASIKRSTIEETYNQILSDMASAETALSAGSSVSSAYYMGPMGLKALEARVYMSLGQYGKAEAAAKEALSLKGKGTGTAVDSDPSNETYLNMWSSTAVTDEDLFTIIKSDNDNLSANALNTLYDSYYCTIQDAVIAQFADTDIRKGLLRDNSDGAGTQPAKFDGTSTAQAVSNIPVFRKSEMSLIIAECEARIGTISEAQNYLMYTAKRNTAIAEVSNLPSTKSDLLSFISVERIREFFAEGHRLYDARRMGDLVQADNYSNFDIQKFVLPIPASEINTGIGIVQNTEWSKNLPE